MVLNNRISSAARAKIISRHMFRSKCLMAIVFCSLVILLIITALVGNTNAHKKILASTTDKFSSILDYYTSSTSFTSDDEKDLKNAVVEEADAPYNVLDKELIEASAKVEQGDVSSDTVSTKDEDEKLAYDVSY